MSEEVAPDAVAQVRGAGDQVVQESLAALWRQRLQRTELQFGVQQARAGETVPLDEL